MVYKAKVKRWVFLIFCFQVYFLGLGFDDGDDNLYGAGDNLYTEQVKTYVNIMYQLICR